MFKISSALGNILYAVNIVVALLLCISFVVPFFPPSSFPTLSILSLAVSPLIFLNLFFVAYWTFQLKKKAFFSAVIVLIAFFYFSGFFQISSETPISEDKKILKVLSYNVRLFNAYEKKVAPDQVAAAMGKLLKDENPDIICLQEFYEKNKVDFSNYPHRYIHYKENSKLGHVILSKYPIIDQGTFNFKETYNNSIYADIKVNEDTIRVYNLHLQSLGILPTVDFLQEKGTEQIKKKLSETFVKQENQAQEIVAHQQKANFPTLIAGDFNNTSFSYVYRKLKGNMQDTFEKKGSGLGATFFFNKYPLRIDFIIASEDFEVVDFKKSTTTFSDHFPIMTSLSLDNL